MNAKDVLFNFVLRRVEDEPLTTRVPVLRALAEFAGDPTTTANLRAVADQLEHADHMCREFVFSFQAPRAVAAKNTGRTK